MRYRISNIQEAEYLYLTGYTLRIQPSMKPYAIALSLLAAGFVALLVALTHGNPLPLLFPSGSVGISERNLMVNATLLMLIVILPVALLGAFFAWHYRSGNKKARYTPDWENSRMEELIWWSIPFEIVLVLAAVTWTSTHELDPAKPLPSDTPAITIEVVALPWKWLFIYPEQGIASLNEVALPVGRPVRFLITADAPMNSFWIPALGGQEYAMTGMTTTLHLEANTSGDFPGRSANYSGEGFAQMRFTARALDEEQFATWVAKAKGSVSTLSKVEYALLRDPSDAGPVRYYGSVNVHLADIIASFMPQMEGAHSMTH